MNTAPKRTLVDAMDAPEQYGRSGFAAVCQYGSIEPEPNEIGGIFVRVRNARLERGLWVHDADCVERVFVAPRVPHPAS